MGFSNPSTDYWLVVLSAFAAVAWVCFCVSFGVEAANADRLKTRGWEDPVEHFLWWLFIPTGILAVFTSIAFGVRSHASTHISASGVADVTL